MESQVENLSMKSAKRKFNEKLENYRFQKPKRNFAVIGKGGTGKTTIAVELSRALNNGDNTICIGIDRQNNHSDLIKMKKYKIKHNIFTNKVTDLFNQMVDSSFLKGFKEFVPLLAPDFITICELAELLNDIDEKFDNIVIDMPPNTQGLSMLNMPDAMQNMSFKALTIKNRLKKKITGSDAGLDAANYFHDILIDLRDKIKNTNWIVIGIPTELGYIETVRSVRFLQNFGYKIYSIIVNMVEIQNPDKCSVCKKKIKNGAKIVEKYKKFAKKENMHIAVIPYTYDNESIKKELEKMIKDNLKKENKFFRNFDFKNKGNVEKIPKFIINGIITKDAVFFKNSTLVINIKNKISYLKLEKEDILKIFSAQFKFFINDELVFSNLDENSKDRIQLTWDNQIIDFKSLKNFNSIEFNLNDNIELLIPLTRELQIGKEYNLKLEFFLKKIYIINLSRFIN